MKKNFFAIFFAVSAIFTSLFFTGCASDEDIVTERSLNFVKMLFAGDIEDISEIATPEAVKAAKDLSGMVSINPNNKNVVVDLIDGTINEDRAIVKVKVIRPMENDVIVTVPLVKVDGEWKVAWTKFNGGMEEQK